MTRAFSISVDVGKRRRTAWVLVYDDLALMRREAHEWNPEIDFDGAFGVTHPFNRVRFLDDGTKLYKPDAGIIRLHRDHLGTRVVTHEVAHLAIAIYQHDTLHADGCVFCDDWGKDGPNRLDEQLCYLVGDLSASLVDNLYRLGYYAAA